MPERFYWEAIRDTLAEEMRANQKVFLMGEDIGVWGGAYAATKGLLQEFGPERVRDTPISEMAITGAAVGAAMCGYRPVVEIQYMDFLTLAMDQLVNQGAKNRYMFGGKTTVPMVLRTQGGAGRSIAAQHSQSLEAWFAHVPGLLICTPSTPYDAKGLLRTALRHEENPVLFLEHKMLYATKNEVPDDDYTLPFGAAAIRRAGKQITVVSYGRMANTALAACEQVAQENDIDAEMIDLRTIKPFDLVAILESVKKTGRVLLCSEAVKTGNFVCELAMRINEHAFDDLDAPIRRCCALDVPIPMSPVLEAETIPSQDRIAQAIRDLARE
jgi:pyruvate/2-oxoglutarate/acetoin dehydrogenase E1 component